jgi:hypothetical protein
MSVGNINSEGNKKNNFPWQLKMLQGLAAIAECCQGSSKQVNDLINEFNAPRISNIVRTSTSGTIPKCYSFSIANVGAANGTYKGVVIAPGEVVNFDAGVLNNEFGSTLYDATGTTFLITYVTQ